MKLSSGIALAVLSSLLAAGCASPARPPALAALSGEPGSGAEFDPLRGPAKDRVWREYRAALGAMRHADFAGAKRLLDDALLTVGGIAANDRTARKARGYFSGEDRKTFRGEPYERAMAYYYRGILFWMDGEPDNARACFRSAQLQDSDAENHAYAGDYVLLDYLDGLASVKLGDDGADALKRAQAEQKFGVPVPYDPQANLLVFMEFGAGPKKYATGQYREQMRFRDPMSAPRSASITVASQTIVMMPYDDLYFQATTRGGRVMDHILANKAIFKSTTDAVGDAAILSGAILGSQQGSNSNVDEIGLGLAVFGVLNKVVSAAAIPAADVRCWDNLPKFLSFAAARISPGEHLATVEFKDAQGRILPGLTRSLTFTARDSRDTVLFVSDQSSTPQRL